MMSHADKYSPAYSAAAHKKLLAGEIPNQDLWKFSSFWYKNFDDMAKKTMLRQLISRWGIMSTELQRAFVSDQSVMGMGTGTGGELVPMPDPVPLPEPDLPLPQDDAENDTPGQEPTDIKMSDL